jgi:glycosyltransferase involved in cell wall biosynthesis
MSLGLPVVATRVGGIPDVVADGDTGYLTPSENPEALAQAIIKLLLDPTQRAAFGQRGKTRAEQFSLETMESLLLELYRNLTAEKGLNRKQIAANKRP